VDPLVNNKVWSFPQQSSPSRQEESSKPLIVVHFTPEKILTDSRYVQWMEEFGDDTQHLLLNDSCRSFGSEAVHRLQYKLNLVDEHIFPLLHSQGERISHSSSISSSDEQEQENMDDGKNDGKTTRTNPNNNKLISSTIDLPPQLKNIKAPIILGETLLNYCIRPHKGIDE